MLWFVRKLALEKPAKAGDGVKVMKVCTCVTAP
jgi:hypothetical protein